MKQVDTKNEKNTKLEKTEKQVRTTKQEKVMTQETFMLQANITVEASFVLPIVIYMIFALIYLAFYLHDRCLLQGTMDKVLYKASVTEKYDSDIATGAVSYESIKEQSVFSLFDDGSEGQAKITRYLQQELRKGLFLLKLSSVEVKTNKYNITVSVGVNTQVELPLFGQLFGRYSHIQIEQSNPVHHPAETIRMAEVILDTGSEIKGVNKLKDAVERFLSHED